MIEGFEKACEKALEILPGIFQFLVSLCITQVILMNDFDEFLDLTCYTIKNIRDSKEVVKAIKSSVASKQVRESNISTSYRTAFLHIGLL